MLDLYDTKSQQKGIESIKAGNQGARPPIESYAGLKKMGLYFLSLDFHFELVAASQELACGAY